MAGEIIAGRFELIEQIARGGSGTVWLARDLQRGQQCAAKVMRQSYSGEILRFVREQGVKFDHPHLLTPYGWAAVDDRVVIATELMRGGNLHTAMQDYGAFSAPLVAEILVQLLDGLSHVHESGWVHRDVKPANVLLESTGDGVPVVRLADFGIATHRDEPRLTEHGVVVGTAGFIAPELTCGHQPEPFQDLYALGVLAVQLLHPQLRGDALAERCRTGGFCTEEELEAVLDGLLSRDPRQRSAAAARAPQALAGLRREDGYEVASGERLEVFDHFAPQLTQDAPQPSGTETQPAVPSETRPVVQSKTQPVAEPAPAPAPKPSRGGPRSAVQLLPWIALLLALVLGVLSLWLVFGQSPDAATASEAAAVAGVEAAWPPGG